MRSNIIKNYYNTGGEGLAEKETVIIPKERLLEMLEALKQIEVITRNLSQFNSTYEKIHALACEGLKT